jgi:hypothetical protein
MEYRRCLPARSPYLQTPECPGDLFKAYSENENAYVTVSNIERTIEDSSYDSFLPHIYERLANEIKSFMMEDKSYSREEFVNLLMEQTLHCMKRSQTTEPMLEAIISRKPM